MRVTKEKAAENRARILAAAARLFRERGLSGVGVDTLGEAAGMTHGSLYSQFGSKERLAAEALRRGAGPQRQQGRARGRGAWHRGVARLYRPLPLGAAPGRAGAGLRPGRPRLRDPAPAAGGAAGLRRGAAGHDRAHRAAAARAEAAGAGGRGPGGHGDAGGRAGPRPGGGRPRLSERILAAARERLTEDMPASA